MNRLFTILTVTAATALGGVTIPAAASPSLQSATAGTTSGVNVIDVAALKINYQGRMLTAAQAETIRASRENARRTFVLVYDPAAASTGVAHAFDSDTEAAAYGSGVVEANRAAVSAKHTTSMNRALVAPLPACPGAHNISRMYEHTNCGGLTFPFLLTDNEPTFNPYGWNNRGSSLVAGETTSNCTILVRLYPGINYTYTQANFYGDPDVAQSYNFNSSQNDNFESGKSTCS